MRTEGWTIERFLKSSTVELLHRLEGNHDAQRAYFIYDIPLHEHIRYKRANDKSMYTTGLLSWITFLIEDGQLPASYNAIAHLLQKYEIYTCTGKVWRKRVLIEKVKTYQLKTHWSYFQTDACVPHMLWRKYAHKGGAAALNNL